ncbi:MAG: 4-hydroxy-3-methylbut-2-enyl diphosphate reductase, partial [Acholeplasmataceae bacterium]|nr:4-hydroxy-3-methylbut-2-enyl diphosphate reductase [Acholeplasmataceae bacterium]
MKVLPITPRGFCPGVVRAIAIVEKVLADPTYPRPIQILGMIVHNRYVVDELKAKGALTVFDEGR